MIEWRRAAAAGALAMSLLVPVPARAQSGDAAPWLADRGPGIRTSIFGTYVRHGELLVSPFFEYDYDNDFEYKPSELGYGLDQDFEGRFRAPEGLVFLTYGFTDWLAMEFEAAVISASLEKAPDDPSSLPNKLEESGQGDWQVQLDWRMLTETATRPEAFGYLEAEMPSNRDKVLIGTPDWTFKLGGGLNRGLGWGTLTGRAGVEYSLETEEFQFGEYALEYLKRLSPRWRVYAGFEGNQDELSLIGEAQLHFSERAYLRANLGRGLTAKSTDWAPDVGLVFAFPRGGAAGN